MKVVALSLNRKNYDINGMEDVGLYTIAQVLRNANHDVKLSVMFDGNINLDEINEFSPQVIIISAYSWYPCVSDDVENMSIISNFCTGIKRYNPNVFVVLGGYPVSYYWKETMEAHSFIDSVILMEGEYTSLELIRVIEAKLDLSKVKGIAYRKEGYIIRNEDREMLVDLDSLPLPARDSMEQYDIKVATIAASRGCMRNCSFCVVNDYWKSWRTKSVDKIVEEVLQLYNQYSIRRFNFVDASFEDSKPYMNRMVELANRIIELELDISYYIQIRSETCCSMSNETIQLLKKSGLRGVSIGVETFSTEDRLLYGKYASIEENVKAIRRFRDYDIAVAFNMITFNPYSTFISLKENLYWLNKLGYAYDATKFNSFYQRHKGTRLYSKIAQDNLVSSDCYGLMDIYSYKFADERIENLVAFIKSYFFEKCISEKVNKLHYYGHEFYFFQHYIKSIIKATEDNFNCINDYYKEVQLIFEELGSQFVTLFEELINIAEHSWDIEEAIRIADHYLKNDKIDQLINNIEKLSFKFLRKINRFNGNILEGSKSVRV